MRILSTKLPLKSTVTKDSVYEIIIAWLKNAGPTRAVGEKFEQCENKSEVRLVDGYCTLETLSNTHNGIDYFAFRLSHIYHEQTWDTEIIYAENEDHKSVTFHIYCSGDTTKFDNVPKVRSEIIRTFIQKGSVASGCLPIQVSPIEADYGQIELYAEIVNGKCKLPLPMVFISKIFDSAGYEVDAEMLAFRLAGIAYVVVEKDTDFSFNLKERAGSQVPFNGRVGIFYPNGKIDRLCRAQALWGELDVKILNDIVKAVTSQVDKTAPTWGQFYADKIALDAKHSAELLDDYISGYDTLDDKLKAAKEKIAMLTEENTSLRNKNDSLQAALTACGIEESIIAKSEVKEFFDGEQHDFLVTVLKDAADRCGGFDTRQYELIKSFLANNEYIGNGRETEAVVRRVLSSGEPINKRDIADLERVGFDLVSENPHYKFVYRGNERYWFTVSKTPSDRRSGMNNASDIIKRLTVYRSDKKK